MKINFSTIWNWVIYSSENPEKVSQTIKGSAFLTLALGIAQILHIQGFSDVADHGVTFIVAFSVLIGKAWTLVGAIRKLHRTFSGTNKVLSDQTLS